MEKTPKISLQLVFHDTSFSYLCLIRLQKKQNTGQNLERELLARSSLSSGVASHFNLNLSSSNAFDDGGKFLFYHQLITSWYMPASPFLVLETQNSWRKKSQTNKPAKCTLYLGIIRSQNSDSEIGSLAHQLIVNNIKPLPIKFSPFAGKLQIVAVNVCSFVSKKNHICSRSATYKCLCTSVCP